MVYEELRRLAAARMAHESSRARRSNRPRSCTEAWLRLIGKGNRKWDGRAHFFGAAAEAMRRILIERARRKRAVASWWADSNEWIFKMWIWLPPVMTTNFWRVRRGARQTCGPTQRGSGTGRVKFRYFVAVNQRRGVRKYWDERSPRTARYCWNSRSSVAFQVRWGTGANKTAIHEFD